MSPHSFTEREISFLGDLTKCTAHLSAEKCIEEPLAHEVVLFARKFQQPERMIELFLSAALSPKQIGLWELLGELEDTWEEHWKSRGFKSPEDLTKGLGLWELQRIRHMFGF